MKILSYLIIIFLAPTLILLNFRTLIYNQSFYESEFAKLNVYENFESAEVVNLQSSKLIQFFCCQGTLDEKFYSEREGLHLKDVRKLISTVNAMFFYLLIVMLAITVPIYFKKKVHILLAGYKIASIATLICILVLWLSSLVNFDAMFVTFHDLSFNNDYWLLSEESNLIKMFPPQFFVDFANRVALQTVVMALLIFILTSFVGKHASKKH